MNQAVTPASGLRVMHVAATADGAHWMYEQLRELRARGHEVSAVIAGEGGTLAPTLAAAGIPYHVLDLDVLTTRRPLLVIARLLALVRLLRRVRPDVVQYHLFPSVILGRLAAWLADVPVRFSMIASPAHLEVPALAAIDAGTAWTDTKVIASCALTRTLYARRGVPADRVDVIYYGADARVFDPARADGARVRRELGIDPATPTVGMVAWFYPPRRSRAFTPPHLIDRGVKGHEVLLRAVPRVLARVPDAVVLLVGDGWGTAGPAYVAQLRALAADLGVSHAVRFTGARGDIPDTLAACDVSVQCPLSDNLGGSLESLLMARPLVATAVGGLVDSVRHEETGLLVPPDQPDALADAIVRLLIDRQLATHLAAQGRALALERFTLQTTADALDALYRTHAEATRGDDAAAARATHGAPTVAPARAIEEIQRRGVGSGSGPGGDGGTGGTGDVVQQSAAPNARRAIAGAVTHRPARARGYRLRRTIGRGLVLSVWGWTLPARFARERWRRRAALGRGAADPHARVRVFHVAGAQHAKWLVSICQQLRARGYDAQAIIGDPDGDLAAGLREAGVPFHCVALTVGAPRAARIDSEVGHGGSARANRLDGAGGIDGAVRPGAAGAAGVDGAPHAPRRLRRRHADEGEVDRRGEPGLGESPVAGWRARLRLLAYVVHLPVAVWRLARLFRRERVTIVHTHIFNSIFIGRLAAWLARVPHRVAMVPGPLHLEAPLTRWADRLTCWMDHRVIAGSEWTRDRYRALGLRAPRLECIRYGADADLFDPAHADPTRTRRELGLGADVPLIGLVAWFYPPRHDWQTPPHLRGRGLKGQEDLIDAARLILRRMPGARFLFVGGGSNAAGERYRQRLIARCREDSLLARAVIFAGPRDDIADILAALDVAVQCSLSENYGGTIEALLMERPIVATRVGGMPETVRDGETGLLVPPADPEALAAAILRLLADPSTARAMGRAGRRLMLERFQIARTTESIAALYDRLRDPSAAVRDLPSPAPREPAS